MDINTIIRDVIMLVLLPLVGIAVKALATYLKSKTDNATVEKYIGLAESAVAQAVEYVAQTYVDALKSEGEFSKDAQEHAFELAKEKAIEILGAEAVEMLNSIYGDFTVWIETAIEQHCREIKQPFGTLEVAANEN